MLDGLFFALAVAAQAIAAGVTAAPRPHLIAMLADDLGYYDTAVHNPASPTPQIASLAKDGLLLDRHYVFRYCSPSRRSFLTGRLPTSITTVQPDGGHFCSDFTPLATTILSEKLKSVGYACHFVGKGHLGYQTMDHLPINRGFASHIGYLDGSEGYAHGGGSSDPTKGKHDLWRDRLPAVSDVPKMTYSADCTLSAASRISSARALVDPCVSRTCPAQITPPPRWASSRRTAAATTTPHQRHRSSCTLPYRMCTRRTPCRLRGRCRTSP